MKRALILLSFHIVLQGIVHLFAYYEITEWSFVSYIVGYLGGMLVSNFTITKDTK